MPVALKTTSGKWDLTKYKKEKKEEENQKVIRQNDLSTAINKKIDELKNEISRIIADLQLQGIEPSAEAVKKEFYNRKNSFNQKKKEEEVRLERENKPVLVWFEEWLDYMKKPVSGVKKSTLNNRKQCCDLLKEYNQPVTLPRLNRAYLEGFLGFLVDRCDSTTIDKHLRTLKRLIKWVTSYEENEDIAIPTALQKIVIRAEYNSPEGLQPNEFLQLKNADLSADPKLELTRDLFTLGVALGGLRISDLLKLEITNITSDKNHYFLDFVEKKTGNRHSQQPIADAGVEILKKYNMSIPYLDNTTCNKNLKKIGKLLNFDRKVKVHKFDIKGRIKEGESVERPLYELICTKMMRKTRISLDGNNNIPVQVGMKISGHRTFEAYARYLKVYPSSLIEATEKLNSLLNEA